MKTLVVALEVLVLIMASQLTYAVSVVPDEMLTARQWIAAKFEGTTTFNPPDPGLEVVSNLDPIQKNARFGRPLKIGCTTYSHGLFCHAASKVAVRLPEPGKTFSAAVGLDANGCAGSVVFSVVVAGKTAFKSDTLKQGSAPVPVKVDLGGAKQFTLEVGDAGDGVSCDQSDWAEAKVTLASGKEIKLSDLPLTGGPAVVNTNPFFSFTYGGQPSSELLRTWKLDRASKKLDAKRIQRTLTCTDPKTGLVVRCVGIEYTDFPTVEWTIYVKNTGTQDTPIIENLQSLDEKLERGHANEFILHHFVGSPCAQNDYAPMQTQLDPKTQKKIGAAGGRPTNTDMSYFNLQAPTGQGVIIVVGWPGQWSSQWTRDDGVGLRVVAGQELTHFTLHPGEQIRTPLMVLQFYTGDWIRAQNVWRQWMFAYNVPKPGGKLPEPELFGCSSHFYGEMQDANEANQKMCIDRYLEEKIKIGHWWMDAGWYPCEGVGWPKTGTWEVDTKRFPNGLRAISDYAHTNNVKTIVWFEPERVHPGTWLPENHPEWILGGKEGGLLNLGNPEAWNWLTRHIDELMTKQGIDLYRQDFNMDPLGYWRNNDAENRQGITENKHVVGYLAYWDYLLEKHPDMFIDSCASGGRRNDLETMRRAIPLWRTDWRCEPIGTQCHTYGISFWIPLSGTGTQDTDPYIFRSNMVPFTNCLWDIRNKGLDYNQMRLMTSQWRDVSKYYYGDYYPLSPFSVATDTWMAWQFDRPDLGEGMVQAFRRPETSFAVIGFQLKGLDPNATYSVRNLDAKSAKKMTGRELMENYLLVEIPQQPGSALIVYKIANTTAAGT